MKEAHTNERQLPWGVSPYIALSIKLKGDISEAYELCLKDLYYYNFKYLKWFREMKRSRR